MEHSGTNNWYGFFDIADRSHNTLLHGSSQYTEEENQEQYRIRKRMWDDAMTSIVFSAIAVESFLNFRGDSIYINDSGWKNNERKWNIFDKYKNIFEAMTGSKPDTGTRGYAELGTLKNLRDSIIHQKYSSRHAKGRDESHWVYWSSISNATMRWIFQTFPRSGGGWQFVEPDLPDVVWPENPNPSRSDESSVPRPFHNGK